MYESCCKLAADAPADAPADAALADSATNHQPPITNHKPPTIHHITTIEPPTTNQSTNEPKDGTTWVKNLSHVIITNEVRYPFSSVFIRFHPFSSSVIATTH